MLDRALIRNDFPMILNQERSGRIYLDSAATSFKPKTVIDRVYRYYCYENANIHRGDYDLSFQVSNAYEEVRGLCAEFIGAKSSKEIVFTNGASSSLNLVAYGYGQKLLKEGDIILSTEAEHASNILPWFKVSEVTDASIEYIPLDKEGIFDMGGYKKLLDEHGDKIKVVTLAHVSNVLGNIVPIKEIAELAHKVGAVVVVDGAQSVPHLKYDVQDLNIDFLCFSAHKMLGPSGVGVLYGRYDLLERMDPFMLGGGSNARFDICGNILLKNSPYKFEAGTPCVEGVLGFGAAIDYLMDLGMDEVEKDGRELHSYFLQEMSKLDNVIVYNPKSETSIVTFNIKGIFAQDAASYINSQGIAMRSGNHCAKILLNVIGESETIRASHYLYNTKEEIDRTVAVIKETTLEKCVGAIL